MYTSVLEEHVCGEYDAYLVVYLYETDVALASQPTDGKVYFGFGELCGCFQFLHVPSTVVAEVGPNEVSIPAD